MFRYVSEHKLDCNDYKRMYVNTELRTLVLETFVVVIFSRN
jgi:hypothetical protein